MVLGEGSVYIYMITVLFRGIMGFLGGLVSETGECTC